MVFILDRSGSMAGLESDTIGGFNSLVEKQKKEPGEALLSVVLFDDRTEVIYDRVDIKKAEPMTDRQYYVRGTTALLDAVKAYAKQKGAKFVELGVNAANTGAQAFYKANGMFVKNYKMQYIVK